MKVEFTHEFIKIFKKRLTGQLHIREKFYSRTRLFEKDSTNPILKDHHLTGRLKGYRSFSITGDIRVVYFVHYNTAYFADIGTHNQVY